MMKHQQQCRKLKGRSGMAIVLFCLGGYFTVTLGALFTTFFFPNMLSIFHPSHHPEGDVPFVLSKTVLRTSRRKNVVVLRSMMQVQNAEYAESGYSSRFEEKSRSQILFGGKYGGQDGRLGWKQELVPPHLSRSTKFDIHSNEDELEQKLWKPPPNRGFIPCVAPTPTYSGPEQSKGYLMVSSNGGLNQMRAGICDMVAVARLINATLVIPELDKRSFWQDSSNFSDIFDVDYFIKALEGDVPVIKKLPKALKQEPKVIKQFRSWSYVKYYEEDIARLWKNYKVIKAAKSDSRLANNDLPPDIQKLRCRVHYDALRFAPHIEAFGKKLVDRMRSAGPFIALHLRYEKDMLAFSGCTYGLTKDEARELTIIRENTPHWKVKKINARDQRSRGFCPLTPAEVGVFLKALGYPESTRIYIAAGEIYGGQERMAGLLSHFPHMMSKETIATQEELAPFSAHASQMAALDYIVSVASDVFVPSYSGNMARAVEGHRRFLGHRKTISPDRKELVVLFDKLDEGTLQEGTELAELIAEIHHKRQGAPRKRKGPIKGTKGRERFRTEEAFYTNPNPDCLCMQPDSPDNNGSVQSKLFTWEAGETGKSHLESRGL